MCSKQNMCKHPCANFIERQISESVSHYLVTSHSSPNSLLTKVLVHTLILLSNVRLKRYPLSISQIPTARPNLLQGSCITALFNPSRYFSTTDTGFLPGVFLHGVPRWNHHPFLIVQGNRTHRNLG